MSFVFAAPDMVTAAAGNLAGIGLTLEQATAAAAGPTTSVTAAAADDVSIAISETFGTYGKQFQAYSARAAAFHTEFVGLLNGGAAAYLDTEVANVGQSLAKSANAPAPTGAAAVAAPLLGGLNSAPNELSSITGGGPVGQILNGARQELGAVVSALGGGGGGLLPGLFGPGPFAPTTGAPAPAGGPWQTLFATTGANLQTIYSNWAAHPFPVLQQVIANQTGYAQSIGNEFAAAVQDLPTTVANLPTNIQLAIQNAAAFPAAVQAYVVKQAGYGQAIITSLQNASAELPQTLPTFWADLEKANQALMMGDYHGAVHYLPQATVDLFVSGININNLSEINVEGPAGELLPLMSLPAQMQQDLIDLLPSGAILTQIVQNGFNAVNTVTDSIGLAVVGPPIATLDGLATGLTVLDAAMQTGDGVGAIGALIDMPAYVLNGFLNGVTVVELRIPVSATVTIPLIPPLPPIVIGANTPVLVRMPFVGILAPPQPITATIEVPGLGTPAPLDITVPGMQVAGVVPTLVNVIPAQVAEAISPE
ncbi:PE family protein [Mycobacterium decipiens]|uniref:PE family protein n=1 Tax=Mycobacterium decipiens TaxID=1430326 RepID=A0A1X2LQD4_9MYCO|nr:PE family protein [Mycobacterium decipiens]OSC38466.1 PE family protein [Mycobacterium decipiens]